MFTVYRSTLGFCMWVLLTEMPRAWSASCTRRCGRACWQAPWRHSRSTEATGIWQITSSQTRLAEVPAYASAQTLELSSKVRCEKTSWKASHPPMIARLVVGVVVANVPPSIGHGLIGGCLSVVWFVALAPELIEVVPCVGNSSRETPWCDRYLCPFDAAPPPPDASTRLDLVKDMIDSTTAVCVNMCQYIIFKNTSRKDFPGNYMWT